MSGIDTLLRQVAALADDVAAPDVAALRDAGDRRRRKARAATVAAVAAGVVAVLVAVSVVTGGGGDRAVPPPPVAPVQWSGTVFVPGYRDVVAVDPAGGTRSFVHGPGKDAVRQVAWDPTGARVAFVQGDDAAPDAQQWIYTARADGTGRRRLAECPAPCDYAAGAWLAWSPDGGSLAFADPGGLHVLDSRTGNSIAVDPGSGTVQGVAWSPDGARLAVGVNDTVRTVSPTGGQLQTVATGLSPSRLVWSPDGTRLVVSGNPAGVWVVTVTDATAAPRTVQVADQEPYEGPAAASWSPDGSRVLYFSTPKRKTGGRGYLPQVHTVAPDGTDDRTAYAGPCCVSSWGAPAWSPDGTTIAVLVDVNDPNGHPHGLVLVDVATGASREVPVPVVYGDPVWYPGG